MPAFGSSITTLPRWRRGTVVVSTTPVQLAALNDDLQYGINLRQLGGSDFDGTSIYVGDSPAVTAGTGEASDGWLLHGTLFLPLRRLSDLWLVTTTIIDWDEDVGDYASRPAICLVSYWSA